MPSFDFADCPHLPAPLTVSGSNCFEAIVTSGTFQLGNFNQTINSPIKLTWANAFNPVTRRNQTVFGGMQAARMLIQPGLFGDPIVTAVYAQPQWAGVFATPPSATFKITLGLKVQIQNPFLGGNCYLGSDSNPITLNLTTGTTAPPPPNQPITGQGLAVVSDNGTLAIRSAQHVDNAFSVPGASGCSSNWLVNQVGGTPAAAGTNTAIFNEYIGSESYTNLGIS